MTLLLYAGRKGWPVESVTVELSHERVHAEDCEGCEEPGHSLELIHRYIVVKGSLDEAQRVRLLDISQRCPIHKTLSAPPRILDELDVVT